MRRLKAASPFLRLPVELRPYANKTWGYYPDSAAGDGVGKKDWEDPGIVKDDTGHHWDAQKEYELDSFQDLVAVLQYSKDLKDSAGTYKLDTNNCTDATIGAGNSAGLNVPDTQGSLMTWSGSNPGDLGEDLVAAGGCRNASACPPGGGGGTCGY